MNFFKESNNKFLKDSFWAVLGNGMGNGLMLIAGIVIARLLGKDLYGEYGVVKTTMLYITGFATFGLGVTSTKYIAQSVQKTPENLYSLIKDAITITLYFSFVIACTIAVIARPLAEFLNEPGLTIAFRILAVLIIAKALCTTQTGILAGFKRFDSIARNSVLSGSLMLFACIPLTYYFGVYGSLGALLLSQVTNVGLNLQITENIKRTFSNQRKFSYKKELVKFSLPIALQESSFTICNWMGIMILTKMSSSGEVGLYTASAQWSAIILFIPGLMSNVVLSYLSSDTKEVSSHKSTVKRMLLINFICTLAPFLIVCVFSKYICSLYGDTFSTMPIVLNILTFSTIFECCSQVFKSEFIAQGKTWTIFLIRLLRDACLLFTAIFLLVYNNGNNGAYLYAIAIVLANVFFFAILLLHYSFYSMQ